MKTQDDNAASSSPAKTPHWGVAAALLIATGLVLIVGSLWWFHEQSLPLPTPHPHDPYWATPYGIRDFNLVCIRVFTWLAALVPGLPAVGVFLLSLSRAGRSQT